MQQHQADLANFSTAADPLLLCAVFRPHRSHDAMTTVQVDVRADDCTPMEIFGNLAVWTSTEMSAVYETQSWVYCPGVCGSIELNNILNNLASIISSCGDDVGATVCFGTGNDTGTASAKSYVPLTTGLEYNSTSLPLAWKSNMQSLFTKYGVGPGCNCVAVKQETIPPGNSPADCSRVPDYYITMFQQNVTGPIIQPSIKPSDAYQAKWDMTFVVTLPPNRVSQAMYTLLVCGSVDGCVPNDADLAAVDAWSDDTERQTVALQSSYKNTFGTGKPHPVEEYAVPPSQRELEVPGVGRITVAEAEDWLARNKEFEAGLSLLTLMANFIFGKFGAKPGSKTFNKLWGKSKSALTSKIAEAEVKYIKATTQTALDLLNGKVVNVDQQPLQPRSSLTVPLAPPATLQQQWPKDPSGAQDYLPTSEQYHQWYAADQELQMQTTSMTAWEPEDILVHLEGYPLVNPAHKQKCRWRLNPHKVCKFVAGLDRKTAAAVARDTQRLCCHAPLRLDQQQIDLLNTIELGWTSLALMVRVPDNVATREWYAHALGDENRAMMGECWNALWERILTSICIPLT